MAKRDIILQFRAVGLDQVRQQVKATQDFLNRGQKKAASRGNTAGAAQLSAESAAIEKAMTGVTATIKAQSAALEENARKQALVRAAYKKSGGVGEPAGGFRAAVGGGKRQSMLQLEKEQADILSGTASKVEALYKQMAQAATLVVDANGQVAESFHVARDAAGQILPGGRKAAGYQPMDVESITKGNRAISEFESKLSILEKQIEKTFGKLPVAMQGSEPAIHKNIANVQRLSEEMGVLESKLAIQIARYNELNQVREVARTAKPGEKFKTQAMLEPQTKGQLDTELRSTSRSIRELRTEMGQLAASSTGFDIMAQGAMEMATAFKRANDFITTGFLVGVGARIKALDATIQQNISTMIQFRQAIEGDFPDPVKDTFATFDSAVAKVRSTTEALKRNRAELEAAQGGSPHRLAAVEAQFGIGKGARTTEQEKALKDEAFAQEGRITALNEKQAQLMLARETAQAKLNAALEQMVKYQEVAGEQLIPISSVWDNIKAAIQEIGALSSPDLFGSLENTSPELTASIQRYNQAVKELEITLGKYDAAGKKVGGTNMKSIAVLKRLQQAERAHADAVRRKAEGTGTQEEVDLKAGVVGKRRQEFAKFAEIPDVEVGLRSVNNALGDVETNLGQISKKNLPKVIGVEDTARQLGFLDKTLMELSTGLKRRFTASLQFMISGALIFGIQRLFKQFVGAAIDVERTFKDVQTALEFDVGSDRVIAETEKIRRSVLLMANEFNVMPEQANAAAFTMVAKFRDVDAAMIATRAQIIATKVATIEQGEALRALTAVAEVYGSRIDDGVRGMQRQREQAEMYTKALDAATVIQQRFGIQLEDTLEGGARLAEVYADLGFTMEEAFAQVALVAQRTGVEGANAADRIGRAMPSLTDPATQDALAQLSEVSDLQLGFGDFLGTEAQLFFEIARQWSDLQKGTQSRIAETIGGRREAPYVSAAFATAEEQKRAALAAGDAAGAAESRFKTLSETVSESIAGIITQFDSLAQNLAQVGFLTPMKVFLTTLEVVLSTLNKIVQAIGQFVNLANAVQVPFFGGDKGLGELSVSLLSVTAAMLLIGNSMSRIAKPVLALTKAKTGGGGLPMGVDPTTTSMAAFMAAGQPQFIAGATKSLTILAKNALQILLVPFKFLAAGVAQLAVGFARLAGSLGWVTTKTEQAIIANVAQAHSLDGIKASYFAAWGASKKFLYSLGRFAATVAAAAAMFIIASAGYTALQGRFRAKERGRSGESFVDEALRKMQEARREEEEGTGRLIKELVIASSERAEAAAQVRSAAVDFLTEDRGFIGAAKLSFVELFSALGGGKGENLETTEGNVNASLEAQREAALERYIAERDQILAILDSGRDLDNRTLHILNKGSADLTEMINSMGDSSEEYVKEWRARVSTEGVGGGRGSITKSFIADWWDTQAEWVDAGFDEANRIAEEQDAFFETFIAGILSRDLLPTPESIKRLQADLNKDIELGDISPVKRFDETFAIYELAVESYEAAVEANGENDEQTQTALDSVNEQRLALAQSVLTVDQNYELFIDEGKGIAAELHELQRRMRTINSNPALRNALDPNVIAELMKNIRELITSFQNIYQKALEGAASFSSATSTGTTGDVDAAKAKVAAAKAALQIALDVTGDGADAWLLTDDEIMEKWARNSDVIAALIGKIEAEEALFRSRIAQRTSQIRQANKSALFAGEETKIVTIQIAAIKAEIKALEGAGKKDEAFEKRVELYDLYRQQAESQIADAQANAMLKAGVGDQMKVAAAEVRIAQERVRLYKTLAISARQRALAQAQLNEAQWAYLQAVMHYADLLNRKGSDVTDPLEQAILASEAAAQAVANAIGVVEKMETENALAQATAAEQQAFYDDRLGDLAWMYESDQLGKSGYIAALRKLQSGVDRSTHQGEEIWRTIERTIMGLVDEVEQGFNIPAEIRMPTLFEVRRAVQADSMGVNYQDNRQQDITIVVTDTVDLADVVDVLGLDDGRSAPGGSTIFYGGV